MTFLIIILLLLLAVPVFLNFFMPHQFARLFFGIIRMTGRVTQKWVEVGDTRWPYLEGGPEDGEIVVMLHGYAADKDNWSAYARHFTKTYRVIAPDLPGFGDSIKDISLAYDIKAQTERLIEFLDAMNIEKCHLAGNSMGGFITLQCALITPERLRSITLFNNAGVEAKVKNALELGIDKGENLLEITSEEDVKRVSSLVFHKKPWVPNAFKVTQYARAKRNKPILDKVFDSLVDAIPEGYLDDQLKDVVTPTLIIWGRHDQIIDVSCAEKMKQAIPNNKVVIFEDCGHVPMIEKVSASAQEQLQFIQSL